MNFGHRVCLKEDFFGMRGQIYAIKQTEIWPFAQTAKAGNPAFYLKHVNGVNLRIEIPFPLPLCLCNTVYPQTNALCGASAFHLWFCMLQH